MTTVILAAAAFIILVLLLNMFINWKATENDRKTRKSMANRKKNARTKGLLVSCPLCNTDLLPGEDLVSRVYRPMNVPHQLCTISGCPHCYAVPEPGKKRECPVCHKEVPLENGHLVTRLFNKSDGKKHVIVTGCTECCKSK